MIRLERVTKRYPGGQVAVRELTIEFPTGQLTMLVGPSAGKYLALAGAFAFGVFEGWLLGRLSAQAKLLKSRSREDRRG